MSDTSIIPSALNPGVRSQEIETEMLVIEVSGWKSCMRPVTGLQTTDPLESHLFQALPVTATAENLLKIKQKNKANHSPCHHEREITNPEPEA